MSQICDIQSCKYISRALCYCCKQDLCIDHLKEHHDTLNAKLTPFVDEINILGNQLISTNIENLVNESHKKLEQWRLDCYKLIDQLFENKLQEIDQRFRIKLDQLRDELSHIRSKLFDLIRQQQTTVYDIDQLTLQINNLKEKINQSEKLSFHIDIYPLKIDKHLIQIKQPLNLSNLSIPSEKIFYENDYSAELASNDRYLLIEKDGYLCLINQQLNIINQILSTNDPIRNLCWSVTLSRFILITSKNIFSLDTESMSIELIKTIPDKLLWSCTCSEQSLYLSFDECGSSIFEYSLLPSIEYVRAWSTSDTCTDEEFIYDICYNNETLLLMIANRLHETIRMDLKSITTFQCLGSLQLDINFQYHAFRCCVFNFDEWLVIDWYGSRFLRITKDMKVKEIQMYHDKPWRACLFGTNTLVVATKNSFDFHSLPFND
jgi:hypothetical protein